jgi:tRNA-dihydrouridine synthase 4
MLVRRDLTVSTVGTQPPAIIQLGASSALEFSRAAALAAPFASGVDLNCGCPQAWACAAGMGAANMDRREVVRDMLAEAAARMGVDGWVRDKESPRGRSLSVKIRVHKDLRYVDWVKEIAGAIANEYGRHM